MADPVPQEWAPRPDAGKVLRVARVVADLQLKDVARAAQISSPHLSNIESGRSRATGAVARRVMDAILGDGGTA